MKFRNPDKQPEPPETMLQWVEFACLCLLDRRFRATSNKRKLYFEHCMVKSYRIHF